jgi:hypothetical protein
MLSAFAGVLHLQINICVQRVVGNGHAIAVNMATSSVKAYQALDKAVNIFFLPGSPPLSLVRDRNPGIQRRACPAI